MTAATPRPGRSSFERTPAYGWAVALLTLIGLWLRIWGQKNGLPYVIPADENLVVDVGTRILKSGSFDPQMYYYPSLYLYAQTLVAAVHFIWGSFQGLYHSINDLPDRTFAITTAPQLYIWERSFAALTGAAAIPLAYQIVRRIWSDRRAGLLAAGFITFSALAVEHSHYVTVDMPMATLALAALWPAYNIFKSGRRRDYVLAGLVAGLAFGTKWNGLTVVVLPLAAHLIRSLNQATGPDRLAVLRHNFFSQSILLSLLTFGLTFMATTPYLLARIKGYSDAFGTNIVKYRTSTVEYATDYPWLGNLTVIWNDSPWFFGLSLAGAVLLFLQNRAVNWLVLSFPLIYLLSINSYRLIYERNVLPLTLYFAIFAAVFVAWALDRLPVAGWIFNEGRRSLADLALPGLIILAVMWPAAAAIWYGNRFNDLPFSYERVENWLKAEAGPGALKLVEMRPQQWGAYPNLLARFDASGANDFSLEYYRERGIQYLAINRDRVQGTGGRGSYPELLQPELIAQEFETKSAGQPGPPYTVVRTGAGPTTLKLHYPADTVFDGKLRLLGAYAGVLPKGNQLYLPPPGQAGPRPDWPTLKPGQTLGLTLYWQTLAPLSRDYVVFVQLRPLDRPDFNAASRDTQPLLGAYPTTRWKPGEMITDNPNLALPAGLAPGDYNLILGLYLNDGKFTPLPAPDGSGSLRLGQLKVVK